MHNRRLLANRTNMNLRITVYVQAGADLNALYGTVNVDLHRGDMEEVEYGNLRNNVLSGLRINPLPLDPRDTYYATVQTRGDAIDQWLNASDNVEITVERLQQLNSHSALHTPPGRAVPHNA